MSQLTRYILIPALLGAVVGLIIMAINNNSIMSSWPAADAGIVVADEDSQAQADVWSNGRFLPKHHQASPNCFMR